MKNYAHTFVDELTPSQRNHLRVLLESPQKIELLRRALGLQARRKPAQSPFLIEDRRGNKTVASWLREITEEKTDA